MVQKNLLLLHTSVYCRMLETRILPYFGHFYINKIRPTDIMKFYDLLEKDTQLVRKKGNNVSKTKKPLSGKTILEHHRLLRAMLHKAVYWQLIVANPAERVQAPRAKKPKRRSYDDEQTKILLENLELLSIEDTKYKVAIILTIFTGVRLGELMGLEWQDVDFKNGIISINRSSQYLSDMGVFTKTPKTESSIREIAIPEFIISLLEEYKISFTILTIKNPINFSSIIILRNVVIPFSKDDFKCLKAFLSSSGNNFL